MWERATETPVMEQTVDKEFKKIDVKLTPEEKKGRLDIKYKNTAGAHVIVELKRPDVKLKTLHLVQQIEKYRTALQKCLGSAQKEQETIEIVCILGHYPTDHQDRASQDTLRAYNARIVLYNSLLDQAYKSYRSYLDKNKHTGRLTSLLQSISNNDKPTKKTIKKK